MKSSKTFLIRCKKCGNFMKYMTDSELTAIAKKVKRCVYCGFNNNVGNTLVKQVRK